MDEVNIQPPMDEDDLAWLRELWKHEWGGDTMISRGKVHRLEDLESIVAWTNGARVGVATYRIGPDDYELLSLNSTVQGKGIGSVLSSAVEQAARMAGKQRVWLITSNDNLDALQVLSTTRIPNRGRLPRRSRRSQESETVHPVCRVLRHPDMR